MTFFSHKKAFDPKWTAGDETHVEALAQAGVAVEAVSRIKAAPTTWLVQDVVANEAVTVVAGDAGAGKTFFACQLAADAARVLKYRVVLAVSGYERPELLRWRIDQADGDSRRVALATLTPNGFKDRRQNPTEESIDERLSILYYTLEAAGDPKSGILPEAINLDRGDGGEPGTAEPPRLLVIDDVDGWFGKPGNMLSAAALARVIQRLNELARMKRVAIVVLARLQLSVEGRITSRQLSRLSHAASVVWMVVKDRERAKERGKDGATEREGEWESGRRGEMVDNPKPDRGAPGEDPKSTADPKDGLGRPSSEIAPPRLAYSQSARRWLLPVKNNLANDAETIGRSFELVDGQIRWHRDDPAPALAEALLPRLYDTDRRQLRRAAGQWLEEALAAGPLPSKELYRQGVENGFSQGTLKRAATELGIFPHKTGFNGGWEMRWTPPPEVVGRGTMASLGPPSFRVCGAELSCASSINSGDSSVECCETSSDSGLSSPECAASDSSCASSVSSCASSTKSGDSPPGDCAPSDGRSSADAPDDLSPAPRPTRQVMESQAQIPNPHFPLVGVGSVGPTDGENRSNDSADIAEVPRAARSREAG